MATVCLTLEEIDARNRASSGGEGGTESDVGAGGEPGVPVAPTDCPLLHDNTVTYPCVETISTPASSVANGKCCWQCRMVCG